VGPLFELGPSAEPVGQCTFVLGLAVLMLGLARRTSVERRLARITSRSWVVACALLALVLSWGYVVYFLRGGPRIIDATSYFLEARTLATGKLAFPVVAPSAAFRGRFTLLGPDGLSVIFPPGYPLLLSLGFRLGVPLAVGPLLAALLVVTTYVAARELELGEDVARTAALVSALCAALRYQTADTMSHGLSALLLVGSITAALRPSRFRAAVAGLLTGWLVATRPMTGVVAGMIVLGLLARRASRRELPRVLAVTAASLLPGLCLLAAHQRAATGSAFHSAQLAYYALADGPPGCFRWGFGPDVGCRFEHADFVKRKLVDGFGPIAALRVTGERLLWHAFDVANLVLLAPLVPWVLWRERARAGVRIAGLAAGLVVLAYFPFYFPGSYPGGGARLLADALPLEHVLVGLALVRLRLTVLAPALMLLGFALNGVHSHLALRDREGGRLMFDPGALATHGVTSGLVWVSTDHGFALGHDPTALDPRTAVVVARAHADAHDLALWNELGRPPSFTYAYSVETGQTTVTPFKPFSARWRWEAEAEWPPLAVTAGWTHPDSGPCLSRGRGMHLRPRPRAAVELELGAPSVGRFVVTLGWLADPGARVAVTIAGRRVEVAHDGAGCAESDLGMFALPKSTSVLLATDRDLIIDYFELASVVSK
jgi:hypothetical protein